MAAGKSPPSWLYEPSDRGHETAGGVALRGCVECGRHLAAIEFNAMCSALRRRDPSATRGPTHFAHLPCYAERPAQPPRRRRSRLAGTSSRSFSTGALASGRIRRLWPRRPKRTTQMGTSRHDRPGRIPGSGYRRSMRPRPADRVGCRALKGAVSGCAAAARPSRWRLPTGAPRWLGAAAAISLPLPAVAPALDRQPVSCCLSQGCTGR
jgi:hypothetical protein